MNICMHVRDAAAGGSMCNTSKIFTSVGATSDINTADENHIGIGRANCHRKVISTLPGGVILTWIM
jgi:hypothetical protein